MSEDQSKQNIIRHLRKVQKLTTSTVKEVQKLDETDPAYPIQLAGVLSHFNNSLKSLGDNDNE